MDELAVEELGASAGHFVSLENRIARLEAELHGLKKIMKAAPQNPSLSPSTTSLVSDTRSHVDTSCAAHWLNRTPQTLRKWACYEDGPIRPNRVNGRLSWSVADIRRVLAGR